MKKITRSLVLFLLLAALVFCAASCKKKEPEEPAFDYLTSDLSEYITVDPALYTNLSVTVSLDPVDDDAVDRALWAVRIAEKSKTGTNKMDGTVTLGDVLHIYYAGYELDEDGNRTDLYGTNNMNSTAPADVEVGAGDFVPGFEKNLIGLTYSKTQSYLEKRKEGEKVQTGDTVYVAYSAIMPDGTSLSNQVLRFVYDEANRAEIEKNYGKPEGSFSDVDYASFFDLIGVLELGDDRDTVHFEIESDTYGTGTVNYASVSIYAATANEESAKMGTLKTYFPMDYESESFQGKTVYFDVFKDSYYNFFTAYETPELTDEFITDTLKVTGADLEGYAGDTVTEKYIAKTRAELEADYDVSLHNAVYNQLWAKWDAAVVAKKYPEDKVTAEVEALQEEVQTNFDEYGSTYGYTDVDTFARAYYSSAITSDQTVTEYQTYVAQGVVLEQMMLYYLGKTLGIMPTEAEFEAEYKDAVNEYVDYYTNLDDENNTYKRDNFDSEEAFAEAQVTLYNQLIAYYGEQKFTDIAYYQSIMKKFYETVNVTVLSKKTTV